jgi:monovalent cation/hydrogen antiporter
MGWFRNMPWAAAISLGAIVAPPDAAAATAILRQVNLPYRMLKILEADSLLNDASALLIYRVAAGVVASQHLSFSQFAPSILIALAGTGLRLQLCPTVDAGGSRGQRCTKRDHPAICGHLHGLHHRRADRHVRHSLHRRLRLYDLAYRTGSHPGAVARALLCGVGTAVFVLNVLAFALIGMQLRPIWIRLDEMVRLQYCEVAACVLAAVILARIVWVMSYGTILRTLVAQGLFHRKNTLAVPTVKGGLVTSWCGMRGIVTRAAAFALPDDFPYRALILPTAFAVVLGSLVIQGLTLRPLILAMNLTEDNFVANEVARARAIAYRAAFEEIQGDRSEAAEILRIEYHALLRQTKANPNGGIATGEMPADPLRRRGIAAARRALLELRQSETIGDDAFHELEEELDRAELSAQTWRDGAAVTIRRPTCR